MASSAPALKESRPVFACEGKDYSVRDVVDAAHFRGEIARPWREFSQRSAAARQGEESEAVLDEAAIDEAAVTFRYQYDLITAEETEAWLEARGLTLADFSDYFARVQWGKEYAARIAATPTRFEEASVEERDLFTGDLILSGDFDRMASQFAWRVAAKGEAEEGKEERARFLERAGLEEARVADWLEALGHDQDWLAEMLAMETAFRRSSEERLTKEAREREMGALRLPLTRFDVEMIELESRDAAREAFMCVRDDGMTMADVAQEGRYPFRQMQLVLEQIPDDMQQKFLSLTPGSVLEPTMREDGFLLTRLVQKREPRLDDPDVGERIEQRILTRHFSDISSGRIRWRLLLNEAS